METRAAVAHRAGEPLTIETVRLIVGEHYNHFELPEALAGPYGLLGRAAPELPGLTPATTR